MQLGQIEDGLIGQIFDFCTEMLFYCVLMQQKEGVHLAPRVVAFEGTSVSGLIFFLWVCVLFCQLWLRLLLPPALQEPQTNAEPESNCDSAFNATVPPPPPALRTDNAPKVCEGGGVPEVS